MSDLTGTTPRGTTPTTGGRGPRALALRMGPALTGLLIAVVLTLGGTGAAVAAGVGGGPGGVSPLAHRTVPHRPLRGTVTSVAGSTFVLTTRGSKTVTVVTTKTTDYLEPGTDITPIGVTVGERVTVTPAPPTVPEVTGASVGAGGTGPWAATPPSVTAATVVIDLDRVVGTVTGVSGSEISVTDHQGVVHTVRVGGTTAYLQDGHTVPQSTVVDDVAVAAVGTPDPADPGVLDAVAVDVIGTPPAPGARKDPGHAAPQNGRAPSSTAPWGGWGSAGTTGTTSRSSDGAGSAPSGASTLTGTVTAVGTATITVSTAGGATVLITVTGSTVYLGPSGRDTLASLADGDHILATGTLTDGIFTATTVLVVTAPPAPSSGFPGSGGPNAFPHPSAPSGGEGGPPAGAGTGFGGGRGPASTGPGAPGGPGHAGGGNGPSRGGP
jgi:hypothetical protein